MAPKLPKRRMSNSGSRESTEESIQDNIFEYVRTFFLGGILSSFPHFQWLSTPLQTSQEVLLQIGWRMPLSREVSCRAAGEPTKVHRRNHGGLG